MTCDEYTFDNFEDFQKKNTELVMGGLHKVDSTANPTANIYIIKATKVTKASIPLFTETEVWVIKQVGGEDFRGGLVVEGEHRTLYYAGKKVYETWGGDERLAWFGFSLTGEQVKELYDIGRERENDTIQ